MDPYDKFFVKKAYNQLSISPSTMANQQLNWKQWWKLKYSPRLLLLGWKVAAFNVLTTKENLIRRGIITQGPCIQRHSDLESVFHLFVSCPLAWALHFATGGLKTSLFQATSCEDFMAKCITFARMDEDSRTTILKLLINIDEIWPVRNQLLDWQTLQLHLEKDYYLSFYSSSSICSNFISSLQWSNLFLQPPLKHYMPLTGFNFYHCVDGSFTFSNAMAGWGYVVYDGNGNLHPTNCASFSGCKNPEEVELKALLQALTCAQKSKLSNI